MAPGADKKIEKSYLSSAVDSINPWANSRSATPTQTTKQEEPPPPPPPGNPDDHSTTHLYGQSFRTYPPDCPPLNVQWFHAVDIPKRKPRFLFKNQKQAQKPPAQPKKFSAFSASDSKAIEAEYQKLLEATEVIRAHGAADAHSSRKKRRVDGSSRTEDTAEAAARVLVNEDFLFEVNIEERELSPVYWLGPVYEVRRGTWFYVEGSALRSCEENLAAQLEEGYLKIKPWLYPVRDRSDSGSKRTLTPKASQDNLKAPVGSSTSAGGVASAIKTSSSGTSTPTQAQPQSHRLFGTYMNNIATYQDAQTAWLLSDTMLSWVTSSVYERFAGGGYMSGVKLVRGYSEPSKSKEKEKEKDDKGKEKDTKGTSTPPKEPLGLDEKQQKMLKRRSAPPSIDAARNRQPKEDEPDDSRIETRQMRLERQLSTLMGQDEAEAEEAIRQREEKEIQDDYNAEAGESQGREIEHLVLITHGIGQQLSLRMDVANFVHDVNIMRKTMKSVYANSEDLRALNSELGIKPGNCRVQVLPVCWRHLIDFPKKRENQKEHDLGEINTEDDEYPSLDDITIEGVAFARTLISDLALDVLLYHSSYREHISRIVLTESNRLFKLFKERNPEFRGKVHLVGHSLGSAILFDILCRQTERKRTEATKPSSLSVWPTRGDEAPRKHSELDFDFDVDHYYCLGSPVGLFQMVKGRTIAARQSHGMPSESPMNPDLDDPFLVANASSPPTQLSTVTGLPFSVSSPKVGQLFNVFHPSDPISYRLEPLISPAMKQLKPQVLPYTKKGIFGNVAPQGLTGIGARVGQSVSGLWSSVSAGIASNILNRSLGITSEEMARMTANPTSSEQQQPSDAGTNVSAGGVNSNASKLGEKTLERKKQLADSTSLSSASGNIPTLIDEDIETLYSQFQKNRAKVSKEDTAQKVQEGERKARKMAAEENRVRALNRNGRVDYSIQEGVLDFNPIITIASHMSYWGDEDVNHFILSQLLSSRSSKSH